MKKKIYTKHAPEPLGSYSQAVQAGGVVYLSGQIALVPETGALNNKSFEDEVRQVFFNVTKVLEAAGLSAHDVVRTDICMTDIAQFGFVNTVYEQWLSDTEVKPARQTVEVSALPKGATLEVSCIACVS